MADVQVENGFTRIANEILENMSKIKLSPTQYRLIFVIWRYTYGFLRTEHDMSLTFLAEATGCDKRQIQRELQRLQERKIIKQNIKNGSYRKISFNKNYTQWDSTIGETTNGNSTNGETTIGEIDNGGVGETTNGTIGETTNQERKNKEILKKDVVVYNGQEKSAPKNLNDYERIKNYFMQLSAMGGFDVRPQDQTAILELLKYNIDIDKVLGWLKECFEEYKPKHSYDKINSFRYCLPIILNKHFAEQEGKNRGKVYQHSRRNGRSTEKGRDSITGGQVGWIRKRNSV